jgi:phage-related minor tail protein
MAPLGLPSLDRISALPADVLGALRTIPEIVENTAAMREHTAHLTRVADALDRVAGDTAALPGLREEMAEVSGATSVLGGMDSRLATVEAAMPVLVEVQEHLAALPETMGRLDDGIDRLSGLMERILTTLDVLNGSIETLQGALGPMGRLASRVPGQKKG